MIEKKNIAVLKIREKNDLIGEGNVLQPTHSKPMILSIRAQRISIGQKKAKSFSQKVALFLDE